MGRHRSNLDVAPPASGVWKERPSWVETVLSGATVLILVLGLLGLKEFLSIPQVFCSVRKMSGRPAIV